MLFFTFNISGCYFGGKVKNSQGTPVITAGSYVQDVVTLQGSSLQDVRQIQVQSTKGTVLGELQITNQSSTLLNARTAGLFLFTVGTTYNLLVSNGNTATTVPISILAGGIIQGSLAVTGNVIAGGNGILRAIVPLSTVSGGDVQINSNTTWQRVTRVIYGNGNFNDDLFSGVPVISGTTRKFYLIIRRSDDDLGENLLWRFACDGEWNTVGSTVVQDIATHGFKLISSYGSFDDSGIADWVEVPATAVNGPNGVKQRCANTVPAGNGLAYWKLDAKMYTSGKSMNVHSVEMAAIDVYGGTNIAYAQESDTSNSVSGASSFGVVRRNNRGLSGANTLIYSQEGSYTVDGITNTNGGNILLIPGLAGGGGSGTAGRNGYVGISGYVGIGTSNPTAPLTVSTTATTGNIATFFSTGTSGAGCSIAWNGTSCSSDLRLKHRIQPLENSLDKVLAVNGVSFEWRGDATKARNIGFIAQDIEKQVPELVRTGDRGYKELNYSNFVALLTEALKEFYAKFTSNSQELENKIEKLKDENAAMKTYLCEKDSQAPFCR